MYVIGIDGGGTKTEGVLAHIDGNIIAKSTVGATNPNHVQRPKIIFAFEELFNDLKKQNREAFDQVKRVFAGMSGVGRESIRNEMKNLISSILPNVEHITVDHDAIIALYSGTFGHPGIVQIAGTGSITYGLNDYGDRERVGGWGHLLGEAGSGYSLGNAALKAVFRAYDGMGENTLLHEMILDHFQVKDLPNIVDEIYHADNPKEQIASLSKLVMTATQEGDPVAVKIVEENGYYIGRSIVSLGDRLFKEKSLNIVFVGGLFNRLDLLQDSIQDVLNDYNIQATFILPKVKPVVGAVIAAIKEESGIQASTDFIEKFLTSVE